MNQTLTKLTKPHEISNLRKNNHNHTYTDHPSILLRLSLHPLLKTGSYFRRIHSCSTKGAQVLVTRSTNHKRGMVIEYSQTINRLTYLDVYPLPRLDQMIKSIARYTVY
ncbi:hypothetical protein X801_01377, partial [Opisthorchis viverrini]